MLIGTKSEIGLYAHIDYLFRWQPAHLSRRVIPCLEESVDVVVDLHLQTLHRVNNYVFGSDAGELTLVLGKTDIVHPHLGHLGTLLTLTVFVKVKRVYCFPL